MRAVLLNVEGLASVWVMRISIMQDLDGGVVVELFVSSLVDDTHPPRASR